MNQFVSYKDGQRLAYAEIGDPRGFPVLVQHGLIASIKDPQLFGRLAEAGARVISVARPGYGESSPYEMRNLAEWAEIVAALSGALGLAQFDVLGISSGAPFAYALGARLAVQVRRLYILSGTPALYDEAVAAHWPYPLDRQARLADLQKLAFDLFFGQLSADELAKEDVKDSMMNGGFGVAQDLRLRGADWGFTLAEVRAPVVMRHSRADEAVPLVTAELTARLLPDCRLDVREAEPHFSQEVLDDFMRTWGGDGTAVPSPPQDPSCPCQAMS